jgi:hypothetical protein
MPITEKEVFSRPATEKFSVGAKNSQCTCSLFIMSVEKRSLHFPSIVAKLYFFHRCYIFLLRFPPQRAGNSSS